jgi:hypothetical protein
MDYVKLTFDKNLDSMRLRGLYGMGKMAVV